MMRKGKSLKDLYKMKGGRTTPLIYPALVTPHTRVQGSWMPMFPPLSFSECNYTSNKQICKVQGALLWH
jgi:hypothetical protein